MRLARWLTPFSLVAFASAALAAADIPWPEELPNAKFAQDKMFRPVQDYLRDLSVGLIRAQPDADTVEYRTSFSGSDRWYLLMHVDRVVGPDRLVETIGISVGGRATGALSLTRTGNDLKPTPSSDLLAFKFPDPTASYTYEISNKPFHAAIEFHQVDGGSQGVFSGELFTLSYASRETTSSGLRLWSILYPGYPSFGVQLDAHPVAPELWDFAYRFQGNDQRTSAGGGFSSIVDYFMSSLGGVGQRIVCQGIHSYSWPETTLMVKNHKTPQDPCRSY